MLSDSVPFLNMKRIIRESVDGHAETALDWTHNLLLSVVTGSHMSLGVIDKSNILLPGPEKRVTAFRSSQMAPDILLLMHGKSEKASLATVYNKYKTPDTEIPVFFWANIFFAL